MPLSQYRIMSKTLTLTSVSTSLCHLARKRGGGGGGGGGGGDNASWRCVFCNSGRRIKRRRRRRRRRSGSLRCPFRVIPSFLVLASLSFFSHFVAASFSCSDTRTRSYHILEPTSTTATGLHGYRNAQLVAFLQRLPQGRLQAAGVAPLSLSFTFHHPPPRLLLPHYCRRRRRLAPRELTSLTRPHPLHLQHHCSLHSSPTRKPTSIKCSQIQNQKHIHTQKKKHTTKDTNPIPVFFLGLPQPSWLPCLGEEEGCSKRGFEFSFCWFLVAKTCWDSWVLVIKWRLVRECRDTRIHSTKSCIQPRKKSPWDSQVNHLRRVPLASLLHLCYPLNLLAHSFSFNLCKIRLQWSHNSQFSLSLSLSLSLSTLVAIQIAAESNVVKQKLILTNIDSVYADHLLLLLSWVWSLF